MKERLHTLHAYPFGCYAVLVPFGCLVCCMRKIDVSHYETSIDELRNVWYNPINFYVR